jgi:hypothetical protein
MQVATDRAGRGRPILAAQLTLGLLFRRQRDDAMPLHERFQRLIFRTQSVSNSSGLLTTTTTPARSFAPRLAHSLAQAIAGREVGEHLASGILLLPKLRIPSCVGSPIAWQAAVPGA